CGSCVSSTRRWGWGPGFGGRTIQSGWSCSLGCGGARVGGPGARPRRGGGPQREARRLLPELLRRQRAGAARWPELDAEPSEVAGPLARYEASMRKLDLVDLDDLLALPVTLLAGDPALAARYRDRFGFLAVDEYQDVDELQYRLLRLLTTPDANLCVIGDPDQAIYGFRGAD